MQKFLINLFHQQIINYQISIVRKKRIFLKITDLVFLHQSLVMHHSQGLCQDLEGRGLPSQGIPHNHQTVTHQDHVIDLKTNQNPIIPFIKINLQTTLFIL